jgi:hypothetical protein
MDRDFCHVEPNTLPGDFLRRGWQHRARPAGSAATLFCLQLRRPDGIGGRRTHPRGAESLSGSDAGAQVQGVATYAIRRDIPKDDPDVECFRAALQPHTLTACILPDFTVVDPHRKAAVVHAAILYRLAEQLEGGQEPLTTVARDYVFAEAAWDAGHFRGG